MVKCYLVGHIAEDRIHTDVICNIEEQSLSRSSIYIKLKVSTISRMVDRRLSFCNQTPTFKPDSDSKSRFLHKLSFFLYYRDVKLLRKLDDY